MKKSTFKASTRFRKMWRLETGFSMLEAVVVVGVLLALAVGGLLAYGPIVDNAKTAAAKSHASQIYTAVMVALSDGDSSTNATDIVDDFNSSDSEYRAELSAPADPSIAAMTTTAYTPTADSDFCLTVTHKSRPSISAQQGNCPGPSSGTEPTVSPTTEPEPEPSASPEPEPTVEPTPEPEPTPTAPADFNAEGGTIVAPTTLSSGWSNTGRTAYAETTSSVLFALKVQEATTTTLEANFKVEFSGGENINLTNPISVSKHTSGDRPWYVQVVPSSAGWKAGTGKVTAKVTNLTSGAISYKTWDLTVIANEGIIQSTTWESFWDDKNTYAKTSKAVPFGFQIKGAKAADYNVVFTGNAATNTDVTQDVTFISNSQNSYGADWYSYIKPDTEGFTTGTGTITATATHKVTGTVYTKTWTFTVLEESGIIQSTTWESFWTDRNAYSKTSTNVPFGFQIKGAKAADYNVVFTGDAVTNTDVTQNVTFISNSQNSYGADWYAYIKPDAEGFTTGTGTITATATHIGTGTVFTKTWTLTVLENNGPVQSVSYGGWWGDRTATAASTTSVPFGFQINGAKQVDYTVTYSGGAEINAAPTTVAFIQSSSNSYRADWYSQIKPGAGGFTAGTSTITATITHTGTGTVYTKTWTLTVN